MKRRNVLRASAFYIAAVWAISQGISQLSGPLGLANRVTVWFLIACVIGFPFWVAFAWFYEFTPQGIKRESEVERSDSITRRTGRRLDYWIIGALAVAVVLLLTNQLILHRHATLREFAGAATTPPAQKPKPFNPPADTLVVLPFANLSGDKSQRYFSDGITEELTNALGQNTGLRVIAWDTASHYRDTTQPATAIGKALDVANVLTGKILRQGNEVRVIVELVNARTGYQSWSHHYDDSLSNIFQVQDKITASIADALKVKFAAAHTVHTVNPQAYDLVQQARALADKALSSAPLEKARSLLEQAIALDPDYADAHAALAGVWYDLPQFSTLTRKDTLPKASAGARRALALDPDNVQALIVLANIDVGEGRVDKARKEYRHALELDPSNANAHMDYASTLPPRQALAQTQKAVQLDPDNAVAQNNLAISYVDLGQYQQALPPLQKLQQMAPHSVDTALSLAQTYGLLHRNEDAVKAFNLVQPDTALGKAVAAAGKLTYQSLLDPKLRPQALTALDALRRRPVLDPASLSDVIQLYAALGEERVVLELLPGLCAGIPVACSDLSVNPAWLALHGNPTFEALVKQYDTASQPAPAGAAPASSP